MIMKKAQHQYLDVFDESVIGWAGHTRVQVKKQPGQPTKVFFVSGKPLPSIEYVRIAKSI